MQLKDLRYLDALTKTLSFRQTAKQFKVSQSTISRGIARLEDQLGSDLFSREGGKVYLSNFGQAMKPLLDDLMSAQEKAEVHAGSLLRGESGVIRVGIDDTAPFSLVKDFFEIFAAKIENTELDFVHGTGTELEKKLLNAELETAIIDPTYGVSEMCRSTLLFRESYVLAKASDSMKHGPRPINAEERATPLIVNTATTTENCIKIICDDLNFTPSNVYRCARIDWLTGLVRAGFGVGYMPQALAEDTGFEILQNFERQHPAHDLEFITARGRAFSPALRVLDLEATLFGRAMQEAGRWAHLGPLDGSCSTNVA